MSEANDKAIRFGSTTVPVTSSTRSVVPPGNFQVMSVTNLSVLLPGQGPATAAPAEVATPSQSAPVKTVSDSQPWADDEDWTKGLLRLTRRLCALPSISPKQLIGLARALHALERMPLATAGLSIEVSIGEHEEQAEKGRWFAQAAVFHISTSYLRCDWYSGGGDGDNNNEESVITEYEESTRIDRFQLEPDEDAYCRLMSWFEEADGILSTAASPSFRLSVSDSSHPDCMCSDDVASQS
jgi:hypothetical protein